MASILDVYVRHAKQRWFSSTQGQLLCKFCCYPACQSQLFGPLVGGFLFVNHAYGSLPANVGLQMVTHSGPGNTENFSGIQRTVTNPSLMSLNSSLEDGSRSIFVFLPWVPLPQALDIL